MRTSAIGLVLLVAACAKESGRAAETASAAPPTPAAAAQTDQAAAPDPAEVKEAARASGLLGPTTNQAAFDEAGSDAPRGRKREPVVGGDSKSGGGNKGIAPPRPLAALDTAPQGAAALTLGNPTLAGGADGAAIRAALDKETTALTGCMQRAPGVAGEITITFTVKADGRLAAVTVKSSTAKHAALETCIVDAVKAAVLDKPLGTTDIQGSIPIMLRR